MSISDSFSVEGENCVDHKTISEAFNKYFIEHPKNIQGSIEDVTANFDDLITNNQCSMFFKPCTVGEIAAEINCQRKSAKLLDVSTRFLKLSVEKVSPLICKLFNGCIYQSKFPECFKFASVTPIFKKGDRSCIANHRPISILPTISKLFESIIFKRLRCFFESQNLFNPNQFGFRKKRSTELAIFSMISRVCPAFEKKSYSICVFLDFSACFDTISRQILMKKLQKYGVRGVPHELIKSYFTNRTQSVVYGSSVSTPLSQNIGVVQGSKCGPLYYDIYTGDISKLCSENEYLMFADDTCLCYSGHCLEELTRHVNRRLAVIYEWCASNKLSLNPAKCKFMLFTDKNVENDPIILLNASPVERVKNFKYLGVFIDEKLKYHAHLDHLCGKLSKLCGMTFRLKGHLDLKSAKNVYYSCIFSVLTYCICTYGGVLQCTQRGNRLKSLHDRCVRNLFECYVPAGKNIYQTMKILKVEDVHKLYMGIYMYRILRLSEYPTMQNNLSLHYPDHVYDTRSRNNLVLPLPRVETIRINYKYQANHIWNEIPVPIKSLNSLGLFKKFLTDFFSNKY